MSADIEQLMQGELQQLLIETPNLGPSQLIDEDKLITLVIQDGVPKVVASDLPTNTQFNIPHLSEMHGSPIYRVYNLLQTLKLMDSERNLPAAADIMAEYSPEPMDGVLIESNMPPAPEIIHSAVTGQNDLRNRPDDNGMYKTLENMQRHYEKLLKEHPDLGPIIVSTSKETVCLRVVKGVLMVEPSTEKGQPHVAVQKEVQVQMYALQKSIATLERRLFGVVPELRLAGASGQNRASLNLAGSLKELDCGNIAIPIKRSRQTLFLSGPEHSITYCGTRTTRQDDGSLLDEKAEDPNLAAYTRIDYGAINPEIKPAINAYFAYLSGAKSAKPNQ
jgi:hypothetical protein